MGLMSSLNVDALEVDEALAGVHEEFGAAVSAEFSENPAKTEEEFEARLAPINEKRIDAQVQALREAGWVPPTLSDVAVRRLRPLEKLIVGEEGREAIRNVIAILEA